MLDRLLEWSPTLGLDTFLILPVLIALEAVLSADNAIALAAIAQGLDSSEQQRRALNIGLVIAFGLRVALILTATWVLKYWQFEVAGAAYLLWLVYQHFTAEEDEQDHHHGPRFASLWQAIPIIAFTDLAFSLDSVTTAIALSDQVLIILLGGLIGVLALRFMAGLFIRWLDEYEYLEDAGFVTVAFVGIRLLLRVIDPGIVPPDWLMISLIAVVFIWGFSKRTEHQVNPSKTTAVTPAKSPSIEVTEALAEIDEHSSEPNVAAQTAPDKKEPEAV
ncbi:MAG: hypothetical protein AAF152_06860 [Cyanobacteria bacterium P01_A01_bin.114]